MKSDWWKPSIEFRYFHDKASEEHGAACLSVVTVITVKTWMMQSL